MTNSPRKHTEQSQQLLWNSFYRTQTWQKETRYIPEVCTGKRVLELGCGNGKTLKAILKQNPREIVAVDFSHEALRRAHQQIEDTKVTYINADVLRLPDKLGTFDVIICYYLLNNLTSQEQKRLLTSLTLFLAPAGLLIIEDYAEGDHRENKQSPLRRTLLTKKKCATLLANYKKTITEHSFSPYRLAHKKRKIIRAVATLSASSKKYDNSD